MTSRIARPLAAACLLLLGLAAGGWPAAGAELATPWQRTDAAELRLVAAPDGAAKLRLGLEIVLQPGWHTYWRSPGEAGLPPKFDWTGSVNLGAAAIEWLAPGRFGFAGLQSLGYAGEVMLPIAVTRQRRDAPAVARLAVDFLACRSLCVPNRAVLRLALPAGDVAPGPWAALLERAAATVPGDGRSAGIRVALATVSAEGGDGVLTVTLAATPPLARPDLIIEGAGAIAFRPPAPAGNALRLVAPGAAAAVGALAGRTLVLTILDRAAPAGAPRAAAIAVVPR